MNYYFLFLVMALVRASGASPHGAPQQACATMTPGHGFQPQNGTSPFITYSIKKEIMQSTVVSIELYSRGNNYFKGFFIMAFNDDEDNEPIGKFLDGQVLNCSNGMSNAATHWTNYDKFQVELNWMPPHDFVGSVHFRTTFVKNASHYWVNTKSDSVRIIPFSMPSSAVHFTISSWLASMERCFYKFFLMMKNKFF